MRVHRRCRFFVSFVFAAFFILSGQTAVEAQEAVNGGLWSDPATWSDREVPGEGDTVTIGADIEVVLDVSPPPLGGIRLNGKLSFADDRDLELTTEWILVRGELEIGTEASPHTRNATITLTNNVPESGSSLRYPLFMPPMFSPSGRSSLTSTGRISIPDRRRRSITEAVLDAGSDQSVNSIKRTPSFGLL
jgi:hypothetical protein